MFLTQKPADIVTSTPKAKFKTDFDQKMILVEIKISILAQQIRRRNNSGILYFALKFQVMTAKYHNSILDALENFARLRFLSCKLSL